MSKDIYYTNAASETQEIANNLAQTLKGGEVITLSGDLGSGKTTFTQGLAEGLGISRNITSPTFIIMRSYDISNHKRQITNFYHIDLYRTENMHDIEGLGLVEILGSQNAIVVVEWPEKLGKLLPEKRIDVQFEYTGEDTRKIIINRYGRTSD